MSRLGGLSAEALRGALSAPVTSIVTAIIVAAVCGVIVSTTGQTVAIERDVLSRIDDAGTRTIVVQDTEGRVELEPDAVDRVASLAGVEWAIGFGPTSDVRPAGLEGAPAVPIRGLVGQAAIVGRNHGLGPASGNGIGGTRGAPGPWLPDRGRSGPAGGRQPATDGGGGLAFR